MLLIPPFLLLAHGDCGRRPLELIAIDVGQGDAILVRDGQKAILIDGGGWRSGDLAGRVLFPTLARLGIHEIEAVVMTHADVDHCGGLVGLADYWPVDRLIWAADTPEVECSRQLAQRFRGRLTEVRANDLWQMGAWRFEVLWPDSDARDLSENDRSLVIRAQARGFRALLAGDIGRTAELRLLESGVDLRGDLLKVAHHGSKSSSEQAFLVAVGARDAVISAGRFNLFGHPHPEVLARLTAAGYRIHRTDRDGLLRFEVRARRP